MCCKGNRNFRPRERGINSSSFSFPFPSLSLWPFVKIHILWQCCIVRLFVQSHDDGNGSEGGDNVHCSQDSIYSHVTEPSPSHAKDVGSDGSLERRERDDHLTSLQTHVDRSRRPCSSTTRRQMFDEDGLGYLIPRGDGDLPSLYNGKDMERLFEFYIAKNQ